MNSQYYFTTTTSSTNVSQHAFIEPEILTFDAYIDKKYVEKDTDIEKIAFIWLYTQDYGGWSNVEWEKVNNDKTLIIVKFNSYNAMQVAIKRFNRIAEKISSYMRLKAKTYYKIGTECISSWEFHIHEIPAI